MGKLGDSVKATYEKMVGEEAERYIISQAKNPEEGRKAFAVYKKTMRAMCEFISVVSIGEKCAYDPNLVPSDVGNTIEQEIKGYFKKVQHCKEEMDAAEKHVSLNAAFYWRTKGTKWIWQDREVKMYWVWPDGEENDKLFEKESQAAYKAQDQDLMWKAISKHKNRYAFSAYDDDINNAIKSAIIRRDQLQAPLARKIKAALLRQATIGDNLEAYLRALFKKYNVPTPNLMPEKTTQYAMMWNLLKGGKS
ncbi:MAG: hypothetical protein AAF439_16325 [Pseudomonadota bacterium]